MKLSRSQQSIKYGKRKCLLHKMDNVERKQGICIVCERPSKLMIKKKCKKCYQRESSSLKVKKRKERHSEYIIQ